MTRTDNMPRVRFVCICQECGDRTHNRPSQLLVEKWARALGWVDRPDPSKGPREQMICRACMMEDDLYQFVLAAAILCDGGVEARCPNLAEWEVQWSDRELRFCESHRPYVLRCIENDGKGDRCAPRLFRKVEQDDVVTKYWPGLLERYDLSPIHKSMTRKVKP